MQQPVNASGRDHQTGIDCSADNSAQRIPSSFVEPVQEIVETMLDHVRRGPIVEPNKKKTQFGIYISSRPKKPEMVHSPWIKFMNNTLKTNNGKQSGRKARDPGQQENGECDQTTPSGSFPVDQSHRGFTARLAGGAHCVFFFLCFRREWRSLSLWAYRKTNECNARVGGGQSE